MSEKMDYQMEAREIAENWLDPDVRDDMKNRFVEVILALLDKVRQEQAAECAKWRRMTEEAYDHYMSPRACGDFTCTCNQTEVCGLCEIRERFAGRPRAKVRGPK